MQRPPTGARASSCLCADFRAFRFTRRCLGGYPGRCASLAAPAWAGVGSRNSGSRRIGRQHRKTAQVSEAAEGAGDTKSASAGISAETVPRPRAASSAQAPYPSLPPLAKARSFRCASSPHRTRCAGLRRGPRPFPAVLGDTARKRRRYRRPQRGAENAGSASAGISAEAVPRPRAAVDYPAFRVTSPVNFRGFLGGEILRTVRRPLAIRSDNFIPLSGVLVTFSPRKK